MHLQDPSDEEEQVAVLLKANLLMNCVADMYEHEGEEGVRRMVNQDIELVEDSTRPGGYLVKGKVGSGEGAPSRMSHLSSSVSAPQM